MRAAAGDGGDSGSAEPQAAVTGWRVLIGREVRCWCTWRSRASSTWMPSTFWGFGIGGAPTAHAR